jgi:hypothetical protein
MSIYLTLSPDSAIRANSLSSFYFYLSEPLQFVKKYEVAVTDFIFNNKISIVQGVIEIDYPAHLHINSSLTAESFIAESQDVKNKTLLISKKFNSLISLYVHDANAYLAIKKDNELDRALAELTNHRDELIEICLEIFYFFFSSVSPFYLYSII